jgi:integrase
MGSIYRKTERVADKATGEPIIDPSTGKPSQVEVGPYWIKYYRNGRPFRESTGTLDRTEARRKLKRREGEVADGRFRGLAVERTKFDDLAADLKSDYVSNKKKTLQRVEELINLLKGSFGGRRAIEITSQAVKGYIGKRQQEGAANGTINRELGALKRMFTLAMKQTPPRVGQCPHVPLLKESNVRSGFFEHEDFLSLRGALPDYAQVAATLAYYSGMRMGEICSLQWKQINWTEGKLYLKAEDTKTDTPRVLYLTGDLYRVLYAWRERCEATYSACPWICHYKGERLQSLKKAWKTACTRVGLGQMVEDEAKGRKVWQGKIPHDFRRTAIRNMVRAGIPEKVAMAISGHKTRSVFDRYNIVNEADLKAAAERLTGYFSQQMGTISGTVAELEQKQHEDVAV